jgi:hypothetical protein
MSKILYNISYLGGEPRNNIKRNNSRKRPPRTNMRQSYKSLTDLIDNQEPIYIGHYYPEIKEYLDNQYSMSLKDSVDIDQILELIVYENPDEI